MREWHDERQEVLKRIAELEKKVQEMGTIHIPTVWEHQHTETEAEVTYVSTGRFICRRCSNHADVWTVDGPLCYTCFEKLSTLKRR